MRSRRGYVRGPAGAERVIDESLSGFTLYLWLIAAFAVVAIALACTGTYAVIAYLVAARTREFAIRLAVGADAARVTRLVLGQGVRLTAVGLTLGLGAAFFASPLLQNPPGQRRPADSNDDCSSRRLYRGPGTSRVPPPRASRGPYRPHRHPSERLIEPFYVPETSLDALFSSLKPHAVLPALLAEVL
jgi:ABC-type antimicrobial peptide transport system permease subunit